jgi:hypothetical protein
MGDGIVLRKQRSRYPPKPRARRQELRRRSETAARLSTTPTNHGEKTAANQPRPHACARAQVERMEIDPPGSKGSRKPKQSRRRRGETAAPTSRRYAEPGARCLASEPPLRVAASVRGRAPRAVGQPPRRRRQLAPPNPSPRRQLWEMFGDVFWGEFGVSVLIGNQIVTAWACG